MRFTLLRAAVLAAVFTASSSLAQDKGSTSSGMHSGMQHGQMGHAMQSSPNAAKAPFDLQFIDTMTMHHQSAVEMARLVEKRSAHDELKKMASKIIDDQQNEIQRMKEWKEKWYPDKGDALNMEMPGMKESMKDMPMEKLEASQGQRFDAMFIDMMTRHHQGAVRMAQDALKKAQHKEVKDFAKTIIEEQKKEIAQMSRWKKDWKLGAK
jgi:uncharacterized protein (DUF305 family)